MDDTKLRWVETYEARAERAPYHDPRQQASVDVPSFKTATIDRLTRWADNHGLSARFLQVHLGSDDFPYTKASRNEINLRARIGTFADYGHPNNYVLVGVNLKPNGHIHAIDDIIFEIEKAATGTRKTCTPFEAMDHRVDLEEPFIWLREGIERAATDDHHPSFVDEAENMIKAFALFRLALNERLYGVLQQEEFLWCFKEALEYMVVPKMKSRGKQVDGADDDMDMD